MRAYANTPKHRRINPPYSHNDSGVQSGSKSRVDYEEIADEIEDDRKHYESRIRQMSKEWGLERNALRTERSTLRAEIKRLEFIIWNWEELDRKREAD
jgi:predicted peptidase